MSKFSELSRQVREAGKRYAKIVLAGGQPKLERSALKRWSKLSLQQVRLAKTAAELSGARSSAPSNSEAEELATTKLGAFVTNRESVPLV